MDEVRQKETVNDHLLINALMTLTKILQECSVLTGKGSAIMTPEAWGKTAVFMMCDCSNQSVLLIMAVLNLSITKHRLVPCFAYTSICRQTRTFSK